MPVWDQFITERDRVVFQEAGYGAMVGFGQHPAVLVVDVNRSFCGGDAPQPIVDTLARHRNSCGAEAWSAVEKIVELLAAARSKSVPVFYSTGLVPKVGIFGRGRWADKNSRNVEDLIDPAGNDIVSPITPMPGEIILTKSKPSVFFGTDLSAYLVDLSIDTLLVCGTTTSGCVRATVVDAFSLNYRVAVAEDATFDRGEASHAVNLFDMHQKYADVRPTSELVTYLRSLPTGGVKTDLRAQATRSTART